MLRRLGAPRAFVWGFASQGFSSATSLLLTVLGGRVLGPAGLGVVVIGWLAYLAALGVQRAVVTKPLVSISAAAAEPERLTAGRRGLTASLAIGGAATAVLAVCGASVPGAVGRGLLLFTPWVAAALIQDYWRSVLFRDGRASAAAANDGVWLASMVVLAVPAWLVGTHAAVVAAWGGGAAAAAAAGIAQTRLRPTSPAVAVAWWKRELWPFSRWLVLEDGVYTGATLLTTVVITAALGAAAVGGLRAAQSIFAPLSLVTPAVALPGLPALAREVTRSARGALVLAGRLSVAVCAVAVAYVVLVVAAAATVIPLVFGSSFLAYRGVALPIGAWQLAAAVAVGFRLLLTARRRGSDLLLARVAESAAILAFVAALAPRYGVLGAAWGYAVGVAGGTAVVIVLALRDHRATVRRPVAVGTR